MEIPRPPQTLPPRNNQGHGIIRDIKIKIAAQKTVEFFKEYYALLLIVAALGLSGYNTSLIKMGYAGGTPTAPTVKKLTSEDLQKMVDSGAPVLGNPDAKVTVIE